MIYLSHLKWEDFDPEHKMRIKMFWDCMLNNEKEKASIQGWMWIYGVKSSQVREIVTDLRRNKERVNAHLNSVCEYNEKEDRYILKNKYHSLLENEFLDFKHHDIQELYLERALGKKINVFKNKDDK